MLYVLISAGFHVISQRIRTCSRDYIIDAVSTLEFGIIIGVLGCHNGSELLLNGIVFFQ